MDVFPKMFLQIILAVNWLVRPSSRFPKQQQGPSLLYLSFFHVAAGPGHGPSGRMRGPEVQHEQPDGGSVLGDQLVLPADGHGPARHRVRGRAVHQGVLRHPPHHTLP